MGGFKYIFCILGKFSFVARGIVIMCMYTGIVYFYFGISINIQMDSLLPKPGKKFHIINKTLVKNEIFFVHHDHDESCWA